MRSGKANWLIIAAVSVACICLGSCGLVALRGAQFVEGAQANAELAANKAELAFLDFTSNWTPESMYRHFHPSVKKAVGMPKKKTADSMKEFFGGITSSEAPVLKNHRMQTKGTNTEFFMDFTIKFKCKRGNATCTIRMLEKDGAIGVMKFELYIPD